MNYKSGKTFRKHGTCNSRDVSMFVNFDDRQRRSVDVFGYEFQSNVLYSMKKKERWRLPEMISNDSADLDFPVVYSKHQCIFNEVPLLDLYLYDSVSNKSMGSIDISNRQLGKGNFNFRSVFNEIENEDDYTHRERKLYEKSKTQKKANYQAHATDEQLPPKIEYLRNKELREDCVHFSENVHMMDLSKVNIIQPDRYRYLKRSYTRKRESADKMLCTDYDDDDEENVEEISLENEHRKPFIITGDDFLCKNNGNNQRTRKQKKKKQCFRRKYFVKIERSMLTNEVTDTIVTDESIVLACNNVIPLTVIDVSRDQFMEELRTIVSFCKCWKTISKPLTIMLDLDRFETSRDKSFIMLRPTVQTTEHTITVKVLFNVTNNGFDVKDVLESKFDSIVTMVTFVQSRLRVGSVLRSVPSPTFLILDESIDEGCNLPKVSKADNEHALYLYHDEWKSYELSSDHLDSIIDVGASLNYCMENCIVCDCNIPDDEIIILNECQHGTCESCLSNYIIHQLNTKIDNITCPFTDCHTCIDTPTLLSLVSWRCYRQRLIRLESALLTRAGQPCCQCGSILIITNNGSSTKNGNAMEFVCICGNSVCAGCGQLQHRPSSCHEMKEHDMKKAHSKEREMLAATSQLVVDVLTHCSACRKVILRNSQAYKCGCQTIFCTTCQQVYESHKVTCQHSFENRLRFPSTAEIVPFQKARSSEQKLFNQSVYMGILRGHENMKRIKYDISKIISLIKITKCGSYSVADLTSSYSQILRVLESMYISAYNSYRKNNQRKFELLKVSTNHLLFYILRIQEITDEIHRCRVHNKRAILSKDALTTKYNTLESYITGARLYTRKIIALL